MADISITEAKAHLGELVTRAAAGETIRIVRRGKVVAQLTRAPSERKPIDVDALRALTDTMPMQTEGAAELIRKMRDDAW